jgi:hypothetical protein
VKTYLVTWETEIDAEDAEEAARQAWAHMRRPDSIANVFKVYGEDCENGEVVDLQEIDEARAAG